MTDQTLLEDLAPQQLLETLRTAQAEIRFKQTVIDKLSHETAWLKRLKFAA